MKIRCISLWQPWAQWVILGWKSIETRTHDRFRSLSGERIAIHAAQKWDNNAVATAAQYLTIKQIQSTAHLTREKGAVIGFAYVSEVRWLESYDAPFALIECETRRFGLLLDRAVQIVPIPMRGRQGIWTANLPQ